MFFYRLVLSLIAPLLIWSSWRRNGTLAALWPMPLNAEYRSALWLHAASNGEATSVKPVVLELLRLDPALQIVMSTNTREAVRLIESWAQPRLTPTIAPLDFRWTLRRFLKLNRINAAIAVENELWPNKLAMLARAGVPVASIGTRMSGKSARVWRWLPGLARRSLSRFESLTPQDGTSGERLRGLGAPAEKVKAPLDLKALYRPAPLTSAQHDVRAHHMPDNTWLAASTHPGEDEIVIAAFQKARKNWPALHLILAPRHPERRGDLLKLLNQAQLSVAQHSLGEVRTASTAVTLADTLGEMPLWYQSARLCFVGGSLLEGPGGHTPYEPAHFGAAVIHGPFVRNFAETYAVLHENGAAKMVTGADDLASVVTGLRRPEAQQSLAKAFPKDLANPVRFDALVQDLLVLARN